ncbi:MAG: ATP-binding cassette domain-containing protein [Verrucomicrobiota bacterium]
MVKEDVLLEVNELSAWGRGRRMILDEVTLRVEDGESVSVVGHAGSGKTALLDGMTRMASGTRYSGQVHLRGYEHNLLRCRRGRLRRVRGGQISYLPGDPDVVLHPSVTVGEQMAAMMRQHRPEVRDWREESMYWLYQAGIAEPEARLRLPARVLDALSRVRLGVAMAFCTFPRLLLADDPTRRLDACAQGEIMLLIEKLRMKTGIGMVYATRDLRVGAKMGSRLVLLDDGRVVGEGPVEEVLAGEGLAGWLEEGRVE